MAYHKSKQDVPGAAYVLYATMSPAPRDDLRTVEATLIRTFKRLSSGRLPQNTQNTHQFTAGGAIQIANILPNTAPYNGYGVSGTVNVGGAAQYEIDELLGE